MSKKNWNKLYPLNYVIEPPSAGSILQLDKPCSSNREGEHAITINLSAMFIVWFVQPSMAKIFPNKCNSKKKIKFCSAPA